MALQCMRKCTPCISNFVRLSSSFAAGESSVVLPDLPYEYSALEPYISAEIMELHHSKHHNTYVTNYNKALTQWAEAEESKNSQSLAGINSALHFNGGGHLNHSIFWKNLCPAKDAAPCSGPLLDAINQEFGSLDEMKTKLNTMAAGVQGSGWGWLAAKKGTGKLYLLTTANQDPVTFTAPGMVPLLGIDVWEHAYYLQYKNLRPDYLKAIWNVVNWTDVAQRYSNVERQ